MKDHYDDKLADKFRQELEGYEAAFDPADWKAMQQRLPGQGQIRRRIAFIIGGASLVAASLFVALYMIPRDPALPEGQQVAQVQTPAHDAQPTTVPSTAPVEKTQEQPAPLPGDPAAMSVPSAQDAAAQVTNNNTATSPGKYRSSQPLIASRSGKKKGTHQSVDGNRPALAGVTGKRGDNADNGFNDGANQTLSVDPAARKTSPAVVSGSEENALDLAVLTPLQPGLETSQMSAKLEIKPLTLSASVADMASPCPASRFKLGLAVLPAADVVTYHKKVVEVTTPALGVAVQETFRRPVNMMAFNFGFGIMGDWQFNKRWSVGTGILFSRQHLKFTEPDLLYLDEKPIDASRNPDHVMSSDKFLTEMRRISLNVPIQVRYNVLTTCKNQAFVSAGLSNYVYVKEDYVYREEMKYIPIDILPIGSTKVDPAYYTSTQLASTVNLSAGFERKIGEKLSLQAEPFLRLPIQRSGHEKLNIRTGGVMIRLNYNFM